MEVAKIMDHLLGGGLESQEKECLDRLTPEGLAKLNADIIRGVDPEVVMASLCKVYKTGQAWRQQLISSLPAEAQRVVAQKQFHRTVSTAELLYLMDCVWYGVLDRLVDPETGGLLQQYDLRECGRMYLNEKLLERSMEIHTGASPEKEVICCRLACTACPKDASSPFFSHTPPGCSRAVLALSPALTWFHEDPNADPLMVSMDAATRLLASDQQWPDDRSDLSDASDVEDFVPPPPRPCALALLPTKPNPQRMSAVRKGGHRLLNVSKSQKLAVRFLIHGKEISPLNPKRLTKTLHSPASLSDVARNSQNPHRSDNSTATTSLSPPDEMDTSLPMEASGGSDAGGGVFSSLVSQLGHALPT